MTWHAFQFTAVDEAGNILPAATVEVRDEVSGLLVTLKANQLGTDPLGNPFAVNTNGFARFYVEPGRYKITTLLSGLEAADPWRDVEIGPEAADSIVGFASAAALAVASFATVPTYARTASYNIGQGKGGALYLITSTEPVAYTTGRGKFQTADGNWALLVEAIPDDYMFGALVGTVVVWETAPNNGAEVPTLSGGNIQFTSGTDDRQAYLDMAAFLRVAKSKFTFAPGYRKVSQSAAQYTAAGGAMFRLADMAVHCSTAKAVFVLSTSQIGTFNGEIFSFSNCTDIVFEGVKLVGNHTKVTIQNGLQHGSQLLYLRAPCKVNKIVTEGVGIVSPFTCYRRPTMKVSREFPPVVLAQGVLTSTGANPADATTVTIGSVVYTFETGALDALYKVKVGATAADTLQNLSDAINGLGSPSVQYMLGTPAHPQVSARKTSATTLVVSSQETGSIATTDTSAALSWGAVTLKRGTGWTTGNTATAAGNHAGVTVPQTWTVTAVGGEVTALTFVSSGLYPFAADASTPGAIPITVDALGSALTGAGTGLRALLHWDDAEPQNEVVGGEIHARATYCYYGGECQYTYDGKVVVDVDYVYRAVHSYGCDIEIDYTQRHVYAATPFACINGKKTRIKGKLKQLEFTEVYSAGNQVMTFEIYLNQPGRISTDIDFDVKYNMNGGLSPNGSAMFGTDRTTDTGSDLGNGWNCHSFRRFRGRFSGRPNWTSAQGNGALLGDNLIYNYLGENISIFLDDMSIDGEGFIQFNPRGIERGHIGSVNSDGAITFTDFFHSGQMHLSAPAPVTVSLESKFINKYEPVIGTFGDGSAASFSQTLPALYPLVSTTDIVANHTVLQNQMGSIIEVSNTPAGATVVITSPTPALVRDGDWFVVRKSDTAAFAVQVNDNLSAALASLSLQGEEVFVWLNDGVWMRRSLGSARSGTLQPYTVATADENLAANDLVFVYNNASGVNARKANAASGSNYPCNGFVSAAVLTGALGVVFHKGKIPIAGLVAGAKYLSTATPGGSQSTVPTGSGQLVQLVGFTGVTFPSGVTELAFQPSSATKRR